MEKQSKGRRKETFFVWFQLGVELAEELLEGHPCHVGEDIEAPTMRHAHYHRLNAQLRRLVDDCLVG